MILASNQVNRLGRLCQAGYQLASGDNSLRLKTLFTNVSDHFLGFKLCKYCPSCFSVLFLRQAVFNASFRPSHISFPIMRLATLLLLPLLVAAGQQPLKEKAAEWLDKAKAYMESDVPSPVDASASNVAESVVEKINIRNWQRKLAPKLDGQEDWMVFFSGGNKSCFGQCELADKAWNVCI